MSIPEVASPINTILSTETTETNTSNWVGREITKHFEFIESAFSSVFSNITSQFKVTSQTPTNLSNAIAITRLPTAILNIVEDYCDTMDDLINCIQNHEIVPEDLKRCAKNIKQIDLNKITLTLDQATRLLELCKNIESLTFSMPEIAEEAFYHLVDKISNLEKLEDLNIYGYHSGYTFKDYALDLIMSKGRLHSFSLKKSYTVGTAKNYIAKCKDIHTLKLRSSNVTDNDLSVLTQLEKLTHLDVSDNTKITDAGLVHIGKITSLKHLSLSSLSDDVTDVGIQNLSNLSELEHLDISNSGYISINALHSISMLPKLRTLDISSIFNTYSINDSVITEPLSVCTNLTSLTLVLCAKVTIKDIHNIAKLTELESLDLSYCDGIEEGYLQFLHPLKKLKILTVVGTCVTESEIENIKKEIPGLEVISKPKENGLAYFVAPMFAHLLNGISRSAFR